MVLQYLKDIFAFNAEFPLLFTQFYFWAFFALVFAGLSLLGNRILQRNIYLAFVSLFFYYKTSGLFVLILLFATVFNFFQANNIYSSEGNRRKWQFAIGIAVNLAVLCYFKYAYFFTDLLNSLFETEFRVFDIFSWFGNTISGKQRFDVGNILLPVGISFYTFQNISYIFDVFRKKISPVDNIYNFAFYTSFFPQLVAGPIIRANEFVPQIYKKYNLSKRLFGLAVFWILNGMAKKIILSDYIAVNFVDRVFDNPTMFSGFENLVALFGYSLQVYADFSGYTDIAIGVAMLMGFYLPKNFNSPYKASNPANFWKRWHISLSRWLQDYLYIPLGGNRNATFGTYACIIVIALIAIMLSNSLWVTFGIIYAGTIVGLFLYLSPERRRKIETNLNMMNTMLLGGLWHGASWNFMIWGGLNGIGILVYKFWKDINVYRRTAILAFITLVLLILKCKYDEPAFTIALFWLAIIFAGTLWRLFHKFLGGEWKFTYVENCWAIFQTFVFITFTRLFFRAGSNLDPAEANKTAWQTAKNMVNQIGGKWDLSLIDEMLYNYRYIFGLIIAGMIIHWLPDRWKRRYRIWFAESHYIALAAITVAFVFILYQFVTADLQKFIYFQF
jgi:D-alanyl-lipoteichoic acid acyltransferase DltB (MBOAT superfamily)